MRCSFLDGPAKMSNSLDIAHLLRVLMNVRLLEANRPSEADLPVRPTNSSFEGTQPDISTNDSNRLSSHTALSTLLHDFANVCPAACGDARRFWRIVA